MSRQAHNRTHGRSRGDTLYMAWVQMRQRCHNPNHPGYHRYGARGIRVCSRWRRSFTAFAEDMGPRPSKAHSVDRIDVNGDYKPSNCRWATAAEQANNREHTLLVVDGEPLTKTKAAERLGLRPDQVVHVWRRLGREVSTREVKALSFRRKRQDAA